MQFAAEAFGEIAGLSPSPLGKPACNRSCIRDVSRNHKRDRAARRDCNFRRRRRRSSRLRVGQEIRCRIPNRRSPEPCSSLAVCSLRLLGWLPSAHEAGSESRWPRRSAPAVSKPRRYSQRIIPAVPAPAPREPPAGPANVRKRPVPEDDCQNRGRQNEKENSADQASDGFAACLRRAEVRYRRSAMRVLRWERTGDRARRRPSRTRRVDRRTAFAAELRGIRIRHAAISGRTSLPLRGLTQNIAAPDTIVQSIVW